MATLTAEKTNGTPATYRPALPFFGELFNDEFFAPFAAMRRAMLTPFNTLDLPVPNVLPALNLPAVNVYEKDGGYMVEVAVPGYRKEDLKVEASGNLLTVSGTFENEKNDGKTYRWREIRTGSFSRTITVPIEVAPDHVVASIENGILKIALQPIKPILNKTIPIKG